jgi:hypothetical protein
MLILFFLKTWKQIAYVARGWLGIVLRCGREEWIRCDIGRELRLKKPWKSDRFANTLKDDKGIYPLRCIGRCGDVEREKEIERERERRSGIARCYRSWTSGSPSSRWSGVSWQNRFDPVGWAVFTVGLMASLDGRVAGGVVAGKWVVMGEGGNAAELRGKRRFVSRYFGVVLRSTC